MDARTAADDMFVFFDTFKQAPRTSAAGRPLPLRARMAWAYKSAFWSMLVTSFTTYAALMADMRSTIPAVAQFG
jgi:hypothetical protein